MDVISNMPKDVMDRILEKMPIEDAVRTSGLARTWKTKWTTITDLKITDSLDKSGKYSHFIQAVTNVLRTHSGLIDSFYLHIPHLYEEGIESFDEWFVLLSTKGVKRLSFMNFNFALTSFYKLPRQFYSFEELTQLKLYRCCINPPSSFDGFPKLISLELLTVSLESESFGYLITGCPSLERFLLDTCKCDHLIVISSSLRHLLIKAAIRSIYINAENLITLSAVYSTRPGVANEINFLHHPSSKLPELETICLGRYTLKFVAAENDFSRTLSMPLMCLKKIKFACFDIGNPTELGSALYLIRHSPNLQELKFKGASRSSGNWIESASILGGTQFRLSCLQMVKFSHNQCSTPEWEMMRSILSGSPSMKKMLVKLTPEEYKKNCLGLWKELLPRPSLEATILVSLQLDSEKQDDD